MSLSKLTLLAATIIKNKTAIFSTKATKTAVFGVSSASVELQESLQFHTCGGIQQTFCRTILQYFPFLKKHRFISDSPCLLQGVGDQNQNTIGLAHIGLNQSFRGSGGFHIHGSRWFIENHHIVCSHHQSCHRHACRLTAGETIRPLMLQLCQRQFFREGLRFLDIPAAQQDVFSDRHTKGIGLLGKIANAWFQADFPVCRKDICQNL